jgi:hypothetical protein
MELAEVLPDLASGSLNDGAESGRRARNGRRGSFADVAEHIRMNIQTEIGHIIDVLGGHEPNNLADFSFGIMSREPIESTLTNLLFSGRLRHINLALPAQPR